MAQKDFSREYLVEELDLPFNAEFDEIIDNRRLSIDHRCVFNDKDGKYYETFYSVGATEDQEERPWEYENTVACNEVELKEVTVKKWVRK